MANYCVHHLRIESDPTDLDEMLAKELLVISDDKGNQTIDIAFVKDWELSCPFIYELEVIRASDSILLLSFETKWSPASSIVRELSRRYHSARFELTYFELGCGFAGLYVVEGTLNKDAEIDGAPELHEPNVVTDVSTSYIMGSLGG